MHASMKDAPVMLECYRRSLRRSAAMRRRYSAWLVSCRGVPSSSGLPVPHHVPASLCPSTIMSTVRRKGGKRGANGGEGWT